jgi:hypothetical protein
MFGKVIAPGAAPLAEEPGKEIWMPGISLSTAVTWVAPCSANVCAVTILTAAVEVLRLDSRAAAARAAATYTLSGGALRGLYRNFKAIWGA